MAVDEGTKLGTPKQKKAEMPKGGRKGGKIFPGIGLEQALSYAKRLVSKTAVAPQGEATILAGVFDNAGSDGKIRLSALKQFGLIEGTSAAYKATKLARDIEIASDDTEKQPLIRQALLTSKVFQELFNTYQGDQASRPKIRGRVQQLGVHPDVSEDCTEVFVNSLITAGLAVNDGDGIRLVPATQIGKQPTDSGGDEAPEDVDAGTPGNSEATLQGGEGAKAQEMMPLKRELPENGVATPRPRTAADVTVSLTVDSSLDGDKLEKQLNLLRRYGLI